MASEYLSCDFGVSAKTRGLIMKQAGLELRELSASASWNAGIKVHTTTTWQQFSTYNTGKRRPKPLLPFINGPLLSRNWPALLQVL
ncbi:hypothetical protein H671_4g11344 [Cricetulus griseus]|nr:hypothetical protein H671_4g11344 [Cricetulus griseus]